MVEIQNKEILNEISEKIKESNINVLPRVLSNTVTPVIEVGRNIDQVLIADASRSTTGTSTLTTLPSDKDFYLTDVFLSWATDSANDGTYAELDITPASASLKAILRIVKLTLTAKSESVARTFNNPILLKRGTTITLATPFTAGASTSFAAISGYTVDTLEK